MTEDNNFTNREKDVIELLCQGYTNSEIAKKLCISVYTVKAHVSSILRKMNAKNRILAIIKCFRLNYELIN